MLPTSPTEPADRWMSGIDLPSRLFGSGKGDYELYEEDGSFVLTVEMPGFEREEIDVSWYDGRLNIAAEHEDESRGRKKTYHRSFRFPKEIDADEIAATYNNGVLEIDLPIFEEARTRGQQIEIEG